jgi:hypothetical protein
MVGVCELDSSGIRIETVSGSCEHGIERCGLIKCGKFLDQLRVLGA